MGANFQFRSLSQRHPPPLPEGSTDSRQDDSVGSRESVNLLNGCPGVRVSRLFLYLTPPLSRSGKKKTAGSGTRFRQSELASSFFLTTPPSKCLTPVSALVFGGWLLLTPLGNDVTRPQKEGSQTDPNNVAVTINFFSSDRRGSIGNRYEMAAALLLRNVVLERSDERGH
jgi:hypothetical protein